MGMGRERSAVESRVAVGPGVTAALAGLGSASRRCGVLVGHSWWVVAGGWQGRGRRGALLCLSA